MGFDEYFRKMVDPERFYQEGNTFTPQEVESIAVAMWNEGKQQNTTLEDVENFLANNESELVRLYHQRFGQEFFN